MRIYKEIKLTEFDFWSGAKDTVKYLTSDELDEVEVMIEEIQPDEGGFTDTDINDIMWFERDMIAECLGYNDFDEIIER